MQFDRRSVIRYATVCAAGGYGTVSTVGASEDEERNVGHVDGRVTHFGAPVADADVEIGADAETTTDEDGTFELAVAPGSRIVSVSADGYALVRQRVDVRAGKLTGVTIELDEEWGSRQGELDVIVTGAEGGAGIPCEITLFGAGTETFVAPLGAIPDDEHWQEAIPVPEGWWEIRVSNADGYSDGYKRVYVPAGETEFAWLRLSEDETIEFPERGTIAGRVIDQQGSPVADAMVTIGDRTASIDGTESVSTTGEDMGSTDSNTTLSTDTDGQFNLELAHGIHDITATAPGYRDSHGQARVKFGRTTNLTVGMTKD